MPINTLGGGGSVSGVSPGATGPFSVTVFTTPATADYIYEVDITMTGVGTSSGVVMASEPPPQGNVTYLQAATAAVGAAVPKTLKVGPNTPVTVAMYAGSTTLTPYVLAYNYIGYKVT